MAYRKFPGGFRAPFIEQLEKHAAHYKLPFQRSQAEKSLAILDTVKQAASGWLSGFTTLNVGKEPENVYEGIARSAGHLAGFVGYLPGSILAKSGSVAAQSIAKAVRAIRHKSVPMYAATKIPDRAAKTAGTVLKKGLNSQNKALATAMGFLNKEVPRDLIQGAFHLGTASAISSWQGGVDEMAKSFVHGAEAGAVFRVLGNFIKTGDAIGDKMLRSVAGSMYTGLPSTMRGATTPEQVYEYLLGAWFGYHESPWQARIRGKFLAKAVKYKEEKGEGFLSEADFEKIEGFNDLTERQKTEVTEEINIRINLPEAPRVLGALIASQGGKKTLDEVIDAQRLEQERKIEEAKSQGLTPVIDKEGEVRIEKPVEDVDSGTSGKRKDIVTHWTKEELMDEIPLDKADKELLEAIIDGGIKDHGNDKLKIRMLIRQYENLDNGLRQQDLDRIDRIIDYKTGAAKVGDPIIEVASSGELVAEKPVEDVPSESLAVVRGGKVILNEKAIQADWDAGLPYIKGLSKSLKRGSEQKKKVFEYIDINKFKDKLGTVERYQEFIKVHEEGHLVLKHNQKRYPKDWQSAEAIQIEREANEYAFKKMGIDPFSIDKAPTADKVYTQLGNKTETSNIVIDNKKGRQKSEKDTIVAYRTKGNNFLRAFNEDGAIGNPWSSKGYSLYKASSVENSVKEFTSWLTGEKHTKILQNYRKAIIDNLENLKGKKIVYYKELNEPSHATALDWFINKRTKTPLKAVKTVGRDLPPDIGEDTPEGTEPFVKPAYKGSDIHKPTADHPAPTRMIADPTDHGSPAKNYAARTEQNAKNTDATIYIGTNFDSPGYKATIKSVGVSAKTGKKKIFNLDLKAFGSSKEASEILDGLVEFVAEHSKKGKIKLNIAGNRMSTILKGAPNKLYQGTSKDPQKNFNNVIFETFKELKADQRMSKIEISQIRTGGQTGGDEAGNYAASRLGISNVAWMPHGYISEMTPNPRNAVNFYGPDLYATRYGWANVFELDVGRPVGTKKQDNVPIVDQNDPGVDSFRPRQTTVQWFMDEYPDLAKTPLEAYEQARAIDMKMESLIEFSAANKPIRTQELVDWMGSKEMFDREIPERHFRFLRQQMKHMTFDKQVPHVTVVEGQIRALAPNNPVLITGDSKRVLAPFTPIEHVYHRAYEAKHGKAPDWKTDPTFVIQDHWILKNELGWDKAYDINQVVKKIERDLTKEYEKKNIDKDKEEIQMEAEKHFAAMEADVFNQMLKKGFHYLSGRGDTKRNYFIKFHPSTDKKTFSTLFSGTTGRGAKELIPQKYRQEYNDAMNAWITRFGGTKEDYSKMFRSNLLYELEMNGLDATIGNTKKILKKGFIKNSTGHNKRQQIWFTNGVPGDPEFLEEHISDLVYTDPKTGEQKRGLSYLIIDSPEDFIKQNLLNKDSGASEYAESLDGGVIGRADVVDATARDAGYAEDTHFVKSFFVSPNSEHGALLSKHGVHKANEKLSKLMEEKNIHYLIPTSAAKQFGTREPVAIGRFPDGAYWPSTSGDNTIKMVEGGLGIYKSGKSGGNWFEDLIDAPTLWEKHLYHMKPTDQRYITSEVTDGPHMTKRVLLAKQMWTNLQKNASTPLKEDDISSMHKEFIVDAFRGDPLANEKAQRLGGDNSLINDEVFMRDLMENIDDIGVEPLLTLMRKPGLESFAVKVYRKLLKLNQESSELTHAEGESAMEALNEVYGEVRDFDSVAERIEGLVDAGVYPFLHRYSIGYNQKVIQNYVINRAVRPRMKNSITAKTRPYDPWLRAERPELENDKNLYLLDDGFKRTRIHAVDPNTKDPIFGGAREEYSTLGKLWKDYSDTDATGNFMLSPRARKRIEKIFEAVIMRVPMDSISGAAVLKFGGFTGIAGHGIALHGHTLKKLGGADLDGDHVSSYFGWKDKYKKMYKSNENEWVENGFLVDAKEKYRDLFTATAADFGLTDEQFKNISKSSINKFSPLSRKMASDGASRGRDMLGQNVVARQILMSTYETLLKSGKQVDEITDEDGDSFLIYPVDPTTVKGKERLRNFRAAARAAINYAADPMDQPGLKQHEVFFEEMARELFDVKFKSEAGVVEDASVSADIFWEGLYGKLAKVNRAYFGSNHMAGRKWSYDEIKNMASEIEDLPNEQRTTFLPLTAKLLENVNWSDSLMRRVNMGTLDKVYKEYEQIAESIRNSPKYREAFQRASFRVTSGKRGENIELIRLINKYKLWNPEKLKYAAETEEVYDEIINNLKYTSRENHREYQLREILQTGEHFIVKDITDMVTGELVQKYGKGLNKGLIKDIHEFVEELKLNSWLMAKQNRINVGHFDITNPEDARAFKKLESVYKNLGLEISPEGEGKSTLLDKEKIDAKIREFKDTRLGKNKRAKDFFDVMMLGTYKRGNLKALRTVREAMNKTKDPTSPDYAMLEAVKNFLIEKASNTKMSQLGYGSKEVSDKIVKEFLTVSDKKFSRIFKQETPSKEAVDKAVEQLANDKKVEAENKEDGDVDIYEKSKTDAEIEEEIKKAEELLTDKRPFAGLLGMSTEGLKTDRGRRVASDLKGHLQHYGIGNMKRLNKIARAILQKDLDAFDMLDYESFVRFFEESRKGTFIQRINEELLGHKPIKDLPAIAKRHWMMFPETINRELLRHSMNFLERNGLYYSAKNQPKWGKIVHPISYMGALQNLTASGMEMAQRAYQKWEEEFNERFLFVDSNDRGALLEPIATRFRERFGHMDPAKRNVVDKETGEIISEHPNGILDILTEMQSKTRIKSEYESYERDKEMYQKRWNEVSEAYEALKDKEIIISITSMNHKHLIDMGVLKPGKKQPSRQSVTGKQWVDLYNRQMTDMNEIIYNTLLSGNKKAIDSYRDPNFNENKPFETNFRQFNVEKFQEDIGEMYKRGKIPRLDIGLHGLRLLGKDVKIDQLDGNDNKMRMFKLPDRNISRFPFDIYYPHMNFDKKVAERTLYEGGKKLREKKESMSDEEFNKELQRLIYKHRSVTGSWTLVDGKEWADWDAALESIGEDRENADKAIKEPLNALVGNMFKRGSHTPGYGDTREEFRSYAKNINDAYFRGISQILTRSAIHKFQNSKISNILKKISKSSVVQIEMPDFDLKIDYRIKKVGNTKTTVYKTSKGRRKTEEYNNTEIAKIFSEHLSAESKDYVEHVKNWKNVFGLYSQGAMGYPDAIPQNLLDNPAMKIKGTPYAWWNDRVVRAKANKIADKLGINKKNYPEGLPEIDYTELSKWSNLEAKYALMSLLAHPKSSVANMFGGTMLTLASTGFNNYKKTHDMNYLRQINPDEWQTKEDIYKWMQKHGIWEEFILYEAGVNQKTRSKSFQRFVGDALDGFKKDPGMEDKRLMTLAKKHGISDRIFNTAAYFMRKPERYLRAHSFLAHYVQAYEKFSGAIKDPNHPFLIEMGKKGVQATQFLYSAPYRPMFARTALGKVMTRFQLWSWNSVRFRNQIIRDANISGWMVGGLGTERFRRMALADAMSLALASAFMYSLFEASLPAPLNWMQDTADWIFGDEKARDRAFFGQWPSGLAPLQMVTPTIFRMAPATLNAFMTDDWDKVAGYYTWTYLPFGRLARDLKGVVENPMMTVEKMTGLPYIKTHKMLTTERKKEKLSPRGLL